MLVHHFLALICTVHAGIYRFSTETTPWDFKLVTETAENSWFPTDFFEEYELGAPDRNGAMPVLVDDASVVERKMYIKRMRPICDDYWMDLEASEFCKMKGYYRGRRASTMTKDEFARTQLYCFDFTSLTSTKLYALEDCTVTDYKDTSMKCTQDQAAAVYCWNKKWVPQKVVVLSVSNSMKKFKIKLIAGSEKYGKFYNAMNKDEALDTEPTKSDFEILQSGEEKSKSLKLKVKFQKKSGTITLSGRFPNAKNCFELYYREVLFVRCMMSGKVKIKDMTAIKAEQVPLLAEKFLLTNQQLYFEQQDGRV